MNQQTAASAATQDTASWQEWLQSAPAQYVRDWEQERFDAAVVDLFGFHALQLGDVAIDALRNNRMPHRIRAARMSAAIAICGDPGSDPGSDPSGAPSGAPSGSGRFDLLVERYEELPIATESLDLVVLPHVLEFAGDPHRVLREVVRVLRPEGRLVLSGFNPVSLWGVRQWWARAVSGSAFVPHDGVFLSLPRLRDWCQLLGLDIDGGRYGCYRPPCRSRKWLERTRFMEHAGDRWWPICGAVYVVSAIKRVHAIRLVGPVRRRPVARREAVAVAASGRIAARLRPR